jgi:hypothetical protein
MGATMLDTDLQRFSRRETAREIGILAAANL